MVAKDRPGAFCVLLAVGGCGECRTLAPAVCRPCDDVGYDYRPLDHRAESADMGRAQAQVEPQQLQPLHPEPVRLDSLQWTPGEPTTRQFTGPMQL